MTTKILSYEERTHLCRTPIAKRLLTLLSEKKTNLALSADVTTADELFTLAKEVSSEICILKTHIDIISDYSETLTSELKNLAQKEQFLLFEDRKFADIGSTVKAQYAGGIYRISSWADLINAHALPGPGIIEGLREEGLKYDRGLLLLAEMSASGHLMDERYRLQTLEFAKQYPDFVVGFISQHAFRNAPEWLYLTPGIQMAPGAGVLGQQYISPEEALIERGNDIIIVGRGILSAKDRRLEASRYRSLGWQSYLTRIR